jgi:DNA-binding response OmpR family regulator
MAGNRPNILVLAADARERTGIAATIGEAGFAVIAAADAAAALAALARQEVALVVVALRADDGGDVLRQARRRQPGLPAVLVLAPAALRLAEADDATIVKRPLDPRQLLGCVFELVLRDAAPGHGRHSRAAELGIASAQLACLDHRRRVAERSGHGCLARALTRQIGHVRSACRGLAGGEGAS